MRTLLLQANPSIQHTYAKDLALANTIYIKVNSFLKHIQLTQLGHNFGVLSGLKMNKLNFTKYTANLNKFCDQNVPQPKTA